MRAFTGRDDLNRLKRHIARGTLRPQDGPTFGLPEEVLWLMQAFNLHISEEHRLITAQLECINLIQRGADLEELWPRYAEHLLNVYIERFYMWSAEKGFEITTAEGDALAALMHICQDREQMFQENLRLRVQLSLLPGKRPFPKALFEAVVENRPTYTYLAVRAFRDDPAVNAETWMLAAQLFRSTLVSISAENMPKKDKFLGVGARAIRLRPRHVSVSTCLTDHVDSA